MDVGGEDNSVESPLLLKSTPFHQGEHVLAYFSGGLHEAKVLQVDSRAKRFFVHYHGFNKKWDEWVGMERLMKLNKQNHKAMEKEHPLKKITELKPQNPIVTSGKKRKTMFKGGAIEGWAENNFVTSVAGGVHVPSTVVRNPGVKVGVGLKAQAAGQRATLHRVVTPRPRVGEPSMYALSMAMKKMKGPMDKPFGPTLLPPLKHDPKLWEPRVSNVGAPAPTPTPTPTPAPVAEPSNRFIPGRSLTNDAVDLLDPENASDFMTNVLLPKTKARLLAMPENEFWKNYNCAAVNNLVYMVEIRRRYDALKAKEVELKEELMRCKATIASQAKNIGIVSQGASRMQKELDDAHGKVKEMQVERADVIKGASLAEAARAHAEAETSALRAGRLELLGRLSEAEGEAAALKAENVELLKKLAEEAEAAKKHEDEAAPLKEENDELLKKLVEAEACGRACLR